MSRSDTPVNNLKNCETDNTHIATKEKHISENNDRGQSRKRTRGDWSKETNNARKTARKPLELETDSVVLQRRQKQIDYGKNTVGYHNYIQQVQRDQRTKSHPRTPDKYQKYSRRSWDMLIKMWRKNLHKYDPDASDAEEDQSDDVESDEESVE